MKKKLTKIFTGCAIIACYIFFSSCSQKDSIHGDESIDQHNGTDAERRYNDSITGMSDSSGWQHEDTIHSGPNKSE